MRSRVTRRQWMLGGAAAVLGVGALGAALSDEAGLIRTTLDELLGPFDIADADFAAFVADFRESYAVPDGLRADGLRIGQALGALGVIGMAAPGIEVRIEQFRRLLMTAFVLGTDWLTRTDPALERLSYVGLFGNQPCGNPFARFEEGA